ncbi:diaminobutyrate--2-oxoglutarate transaminase [Pseudomonas syringae]|uniref:diaminobutyrate--2-oxoglutarate transaminase n=1 Tax=Pseudomonas syringae TaxID=317 RepID=UPI001F351C09|nr:diaminobutyrate--2-oxoglutarate transaminase [Pseudomonas syringae]MCF5424526.1 diaminobutyrate--2-oxoglutarate transaminase [Pseudomonas syringae]
MLNNGLLHSTTSQKTNANYLDRQSKFESNVRSYPRKLPLAIAKAHGVWVTDVEGTTYLDCLAGAGTLALGHNHEAIMASLDSFLTSGMPMHTLDLTTAVKDAFSETLLSLLPGQGRDYCLQFCGPSGADAVEAAIKLAKTATGRHNIISFSGAYHGMTHGALALTGNTAPKNAVANLMPGVQFLPYPHEYRCPLGIGGEAGTEALSYYFTQFIEDVESGVSLPAAVILEAVQGEGGVNPAPAAWLRQIREVTRKHGILLILDEVQAGFGRTGKMFAFEHAGIIPDVVVMSKAIGGSLPLAVVVYRSWLDTWLPGAHAGTFRGNQMAMATGSAVMRYLQEHSICEHATAMGARLSGHLRALQRDFPQLGDIRGRGLMLGVELVDPSGARDAQGHPPLFSRLAPLIQRECLKRGLILELGGRHASVVRFLPPLIITAEQIDEVAEIFGRALNAAVAQV